MVKPKGLDNILNKYGITSQKLHYILRTQDQPDRLEKMLEKHGLTEAELKAVLKSCDLSESRYVKLDIPDKHIKIGYFSDPHIGHEKFREDGFDLMTRTFKKEKPDLIICPGDHLEGMSGRPGHIYELTNIGFNEQIKHAAQLYDALGLPIFGIDGNHDQWYAKKNNTGVVVGDELEARLGNYTHLGQDEGDLEIAPGMVIKLYHGGDGTAYADSYKIQKLIESFTGGEKPNVVFSGHYHKSLFLARRNVFGFESGTMCGQSRYMRGKKIPAHEGFGLVDLYIPKPGSNEMPRVKHEWVQLVEKNYAPRKKVSVQLRK